MGVAGQKADVICKQPVLPFFPSSLNSGKEKVPLEKSWLVGSEE